MYEMHKCMALDAFQIGYFITQVRLGRIVRCCHGGCRGNG